MNDCLQAAYSITRQSGVLDFLLRLQSRLGWSNGCMSKSQGISAQDQFTLQALICFTTHNTLSGVILLTTHYLG